MGLGSHPRNTKLLGLSGIHFLSERIKLPGMDHLRYGTHAAGCHRCLLKNDRDDRKDDSTCKAIGLKEAFQPDGTGEDIPLKQGLKHQITNGKWEVWSEKWSIRKVHKFKSEQKRRILRKRRVRHPPQSGWLDEWGCLKGSRSTSETSC